MNKQIIIPTGSPFTVQLQIPNEWIGKSISIMFDEEFKRVTPSITPSDIFKDCRVDLSYYKFNRDEANDYE